MISEMITLDADSELFLEKTLEDIDFTDQTLGILLDNLQKNHRLIERDELLDHLSELEWQFAQVLTSLLNHEGNFSIEGIPSLKEKLLAIRENSLKRQKIAESLSPSKTDENSSTMVSSDEISELLKAF